MKKILLAIDGTNYSKGAMEFAKVLNEKNRIVLTGVFIPKKDYARLWNYAGEGIGSTFFIPLIEDVDSEEIKSIIEKFEKECQNNDIEYKVHRNYDDSSIATLIKESRFADLMILGSETFYKDYGVNKVSEYLVEALKETECPVIVLPELYKFPKCNIIAYDGSKSSMFAIKQFAYLFPEFTNNKTIIVYSKDDEANQIPDQVLLEEFAVKHFNDLTIFKNKANPTAYFNSLFLERKNALLISGAYGKSGLGSLFHKSFVSDLIQEHAIPVFIANRN
jgi:nucleotide-binding universal stress UspA family protein